MSVVDGRFVWVSSEEMVEDPNSDTLHRREELNVAMEEIGITLNGDGSPKDASSHISSSDPLLHEVENFSMANLEGLRECLPNWTQVETPPLLPQGKSMT